MVEEFDDDTDLPLPSQPLPNTGTRGALLEEIQDLHIESEPTAGPSPLRSQQPSIPMGSGSHSRRTQVLDRATTDMSRFKKYTDTIDLDAR